LIHHTAIIEDGARLGDNVQVGAYCVIGKDVVLGDNVRLESHVVITGKTTIGANTKVFPFASLGQPPQDLKYNGEPSELVIGKNNTIREHVTMNTGTSGGGMKTVIGDNCLLMIGVHIAHDCEIGNNVILANNATLAGHVKVGDFAIIGGLSAIHQFVRIGKHAMIGGMSGIETDIIPYGSAVGERATLEGLNLVGLKRRGFARDDINSIRKAFGMVFLSQHDTMEARVKEVEDDFKGNNSVEEILEFIRSESHRGICQPRRTARGTA
jgi:UDP-N-acetylglucosamine acyltransferase